MLLEGILRVGYERVLQRKFSFLLSRNRAFIILLTVTSVYVVKDVLKIQWLLDIRLQRPASLHLTMDIYVI